MMGILLSASALVLCWAVTRYSLGHGLGVVLLFGYFYGLLRARYPDGASHFIFDSAVAGLYLSFLFRKDSSLRLGRDGQVLRLWVKLLVAWPFFTLVLSPLMDSQPLVIQLVGLRAAILLLPCIAIGGMLDERELDTLASWVLWLNAVAFGFAVLELLLGVEAFFPQNESSLIIYLSNDVGEQKQLRIPATFNSAHAWAGTMLLSLPLLLRRWSRAPRQRWLTVGVLVLSVLSLFISAARSPVAQLALILVLLLLVTRFSPRLLAGVSVLGLVVGAVVMDNPRFQRFTTLENTEYVFTRLSWSVNESLTRIILNYPLGNGLGSAAGTSIPFFLAKLARPQIGLENEFARIVLEQGLIGLVLWVGFLAWFTTRLPPRRRGSPLVAERMMWVTVLVFWMTAFVGTGLLASVPGSMLLLLWMGVVVGTRRPASAPQPVVVARRPRPAPPGAAGSLEGARP